MSPRKRMSRSALRNRPAKRVSAGDRELTISVRESDRAQTMRVIVGPRRPIEAIVPAGTSDAKVEAFLTSKRGWIERKVAVAEEIAQRPRVLGLEESSGSRASRYRSSTLVGRCRGLSCGTASSA